MKINYQYLRAIDQVTFIIYFQIFVQLLKLTQGRLALWVGDNCFFHTDSLVWNNVLYFITSPLQILL